MFCTNCGKPVAEQAVICPACGAKPFGFRSFCWSCGSPTGPNAEICLKCGVSLSKSRNTSGLGAAAEVPAQVKGWNWGAFLLTWIWGIGNSAYLAFLMFVPLFNIVWWFVLGARGSEWAWKNKHWDSIESFKKTQKKWAIWGVIIVGVVVLLEILWYSVFFVARTRRSF